MVFLIWVFRGEGWANNKMLINAKAYEEEKYGTI